MVGVIQDFNKLALGLAIDSFTKPMGDLPGRERICVHSSYGHDDRVVFLNGKVVMSGMVYMIRYDNRKNEFRYLVALTDGGSQWVYGSDIICKTKH